MKKQYYHEHQNLLSPGQRRRKNEKQKEKYRIKKWQSDLYNQMAQLDQRFNKKSV